MGIILDLDLTLVDSSRAEAHRKARRWNEVYPLIPKFPIYDGIADLFAFIADKEIPACIVTSSPSTYCGRVLRHLGVDFPAVCYHDTKLHKPHPAPILKALERLELSPESAVSIGDDAKDIAASKAAEVFSIAATWGAVSKRDLLTAGPDAICHTVSELISILKKRF